MKRTALALAVAAGCTISAGVSAQVGSGVPDCDRTYRDMWLGMLPVAAKELAGSDLAEFQRYALRAYDGCTSGDERGVGREFLQQLEKVRGPDAGERLRAMLKSAPRK